MTGFVIGGVVPASSEAYVKRPFEDSVFGFISAGDWVTLLGPRQHGKTSALVRLRTRLPNEGIDAALVDLHAFPDMANADLSGFLFWLVSHVRQRLDLAPVDPTPTTSVSTALEAAVGDAGATVVLMLDEATHLPADVAHMFFSQLRAIHTSQRAGTAPPSIAKIRLLFAGTFRLDTVIDDDNSPFNVSRIVETDDLTIDQIRELANSAGRGDLGSWADRIYEQVGGQPYLIQVLLDSLVAAQDDQRDVMLQAALTKLAAGSDGHLPALFRRVAREPGAEDLLSRMVAAGSTGMPTSGDGLTTFLTTVGVARVLPDLRLVARNALYARALRASPSINPDAFLEAGGEHDNITAPLSPLCGEDLGWIVDERLRTVVIEVHSAAIAAANSQQYRLALAGLGAAYEGMLLAFVEQIGESERDTLRRTVKISGGKIPPLKASDCSFEALVEIAHATGRLSHLPKGGSTIARDWRNLVHPDKARRRFESQESLRPEVQILTALVTKMVQENR